jgi:broad specificity phosphatase PhoE
MSDPEGKRIYIRHTFKAYDNGKAINFKHDPEITPEGVKLAKELAWILYQKHGLPEAIICSPYRRTRETAYAMLSVISSFSPNTKIEIRCDVSLSEYLGHHKNVKIDVTPETTYHCPPPPENFHQFESRVIRHFKENIKYDFYEKKTWFITHGIFLSLLTKHYSSKYILSKNIPNLGCVETFFRLNKNNRKRFFIRLSRLPEEFIRKIVSAPESDASNNIDESEKRSVPPSYRGENGVTGTDDTSSSESSSSFSPYRAPRIGSEEPYQTNLARHSDRRIASWFEDKQLDENNKNGYHNPSSNREDENDQERKDHEEADKKIRPGPIILSKAKINQSTWSSSPPTASPVVPVSAERRST